MFATVFFIFFILLFFMYKTENKLLSFIFVVLTAFIVIYVLKNIPRRQAVFEYLKTGLPDSVPGYDYTGTVHKWMEMYDKLMFNCTTAGAITGCVCVFMTIAGKLWDNIADIISSLLIIFTGLLVVIYSVIYSNKYIDTAHIFTPPFLKLVVIICISFSIRKLLKLYTIK